MILYFLKILLFFVITCFFTTYTDVDETREDSISIQNWNSWIENTLTRLHVKDAKGDILPHHKRPIWGNERRPIRRLNTSQIMRICLLLYSSWSLTDLPRLQTLEHFSDLDIFWQTSYIHDWNIEYKHIRGYLYQTSFPAGNMGNIPGAFWAFIK